MFSYYRYYFSINKSVYIRIAQKCGVRPYRVYQLAHGKKIKNSQEWDVLQELKNQRIISGVNFGKFI